MVSYKIKNKSRGTTAILFHLKVYYSIEIASLDAALILLRTKSASLSFLPLQKSNKFRQYIRDYARSSLGFVIRSQYSRGLSSYQPF